MNEMTNIQTSAPKAYAPCAIYFEEADSLEYVRRDVPCIHRRVDELLTLILAIDTRDPMGFSLKGFRNFYIKHFQHNSYHGENFISLIGILEKALSSVGDDIFNQHDRISAYQKAIDIATQDDAKLQDAPSVA
jgi:hypothetical protein